MRASILQLARVNDVLRAALRPCAIAATAPPSADERHNADRR
jgi:hypothetical protein